KADGGHKRNDFIARLAPTIHLNDDLAVTARLSVQTFRADFNGASLDDVVNRWGAEVEVKWKSLTVFGEYDKQHGAAVPHDPGGNVPPSREIDYWWIGARYTWEFITVRYGVIAGDYLETHYHEILHDVGVVFALQKHASLWFEYVAW